MSKKTPDHDVDCKSLAAMWKALWENDIGGIVEVLDKGGDCLIERANPKFAEIVGRDPSSLVGVDIDDLTHPDDRGKGRIAIKSVIEGRQNRIRQKKRYVQPDGRAVWATLNSAPVYDEETGAIIKFISLVIPVDVPIDPDEVEIWKQKIDELEKTFTYTHDLIRQLVPGRYTQNMPSINIGNDVNKNLLKASGGSTITQNEGRLLIAIVASILAIGVAITSIAVVIYGGSVRVRDGDREMEVQQPHGRHYPPIMEQRQTSSGP